MIQEILPELEKKFSKYEEEESAFLYKGINGVKPGQLDEEPVQFVLKSKRLAEGYKKFFWFMWDSLK